MIGRGLGWDAEAEDASRKAARGAKEGGREMLEDCDAGSHVGQPFRQAQGSAGAGRKQYWALRAWDFDANREIGGPGALRA